MCSPSEVAFRFGVTGEDDLEETMADEIYDTLVIQQLSSKINNSIERQMVQAASAGKLTIMRGSGQVES